MIMKKVHTQEFYLITSKQWMLTSSKTIEEGVETLVTKDADEEIVWDRVERAMAFLDT